MTWLMSPGMHQSGGSAGSSSSWTSGLNLMGQSGGMNGQTMWAVIGPIVALVGLGLVIAGIRDRRPTLGSTARR
jgi:hypothetical protein